MKKILFIAVTILITMVANAQKNPKGIALEPGKDKDVIHIMISDTSHVKYGYGKYKSVELIDDFLPLTSRNWWTSNITATINPTHDARYKASTVNRVGRWNLNFGATGQAYMVQDTDVFTVLDSQITLVGKEFVTLRGQTGLNPEVRLDDNNNRITLTEEGGDIRLVGLTSDNGHASQVLYNTATGRVHYTGRNIHTGSTPSAANDSGVAGTITWDANFIYVCIQNNVWKRAAISTW